MRRARYLLWLKVLVYTTASRPPAVSLNRYPRRSGRPGRRTIGVSFRLGARRCLSVVWRRA